MGDILAVVVKWYTRYFEGVVGASPCEFDSHLPHERKPDGFRQAFFVFAVISRASRLSAGGCLI